MKGTQVGKCGGRSTPIDIGISYHQIDKEGSDDKVGDQGSFVVDQEHD